VLIWLCIGIYMINYIQCLPILTCRIYNKQEYKLLEYLITYTHITLLLDLKLKCQKGQILSKL
jgi:hypothetical protein